MNKIEQKMIESNLKICEKEGEEIDKKIKKIEQKLVVKEMVQEALLSVISANL